MHYLVLVVVNSVFVYIQLAPQMLDLLFLNAHVIEIILVWNVKILLALLFECFHLIINDADHVTFLELLNIHDPVLHVEILEGLSLILFANDVWHLKPLLHDY